MNLDQFRETLEKAGIAVFSGGDAARIVGKPPGYTKLFLYRLAKKGKILRVQQGIYCLPGADEMEIASRLTYPSYVSFLSALSFHRLSTQIPIAIQVASARQKTPVSFGNTRIEFIKLKRQAFFGFRRYGNAIVAEPEKAIIDGLHVPGHLPLSEALHALKDETLRTSALCDYAQQFASAIVKRRLGFLLEKAGREPGETLKGRPTRYALLSPLLRKKGKKDRKWMLIVNEVLE